MRAPPPLKNGAEPLAVVLLRVVGELRALNSGVAGLETTVCGLLEPGADLSPEQSQNLQFLDILAQSIDCLAQFLENTATDVTPAWLCQPTKAAETLSLHRYVTRLSSDSGKATAHTPEPDCHLF